MGLLRESCYVTSLPFVGTASVPTYRAEPKAPQQSLYRLRLGASFNVDCEAGELCAAYGCRMREGCAVHGGSLARVRVVRRLGGTGATLTPNFSCNAARVGKRLRRAISSHPAAPQAFCPTALTLVLLFFIVSDPLFTISFSRYAPLYKGCAGFFAFVEFLTNCMPCPCEMGFLRESCYFTSLPFVGTASVPTYRASREHFPRMTSCQSNTFRPLRLSHHCLVEHA